LRTYAHALNIWYNSCADERRIRLEERINAMPKGPQGQKRPAEVIGNAITITNIAASEPSRNTANAKGQ